MVSVNREIAIAAEGLLTDVKDNVGEIHGRPQTGDRELGWIPAVAAKVSAMFDVGPV
ncbi:MAG: hypothetical protein ACRYFY_05115 [Janthinobacterium lividum]